MKDPHALSIEVSIVFSRNYLRRMFAFIIRTSRVWSLNYSK